jgi:hypothetical protein
MVMNIFALYAGLKGLIGVVLRDSRRLRVLFMYHIGQLFAILIILVLSEIEACREPPINKDPHPQLVTNQETAPTSAPVHPLDCQTKRNFILVESCIHFVLYAYFAFMLWSLYTRLEAGELSHSSLFGEHELADQSLGDPWLFVGPPTGVNQSNSILSSLAARSRHASPEPFTGAPQTLQEQPLTAPEPFSGTPYRLE